MLSKGKAHVLFHLLQAMVVRIDKSKGNGPVRGQLPLPGGTSDLKLKREQAFIH